MNIQVLNTRKFETWRYSDDRNCWEFVRQFLFSCTELECDQLPKFGILPSDKKSMTKASISVFKPFIECKPIDLSIACHYSGKVLYHVGIVYNNEVWHVGEKTGMRRDSIKRFESLAPKTTYKIHESLWQS